MPATAAPIINNYFGLWGFITRTFPLGVSRKPSQFGLRLLNTVTEPSRILDCIQSDFQTKNLYLNLIHKTRHQNSLRKTLFVRCREKHDCQCKPSNCSEVWENRKHVQLISACNSIHQAQVISYSDGCIQKAVFINSLSSQSRQGQQFYGAIKARNFILKVNKSNLKVKPLLSRSRTSLKTDFTFKVKAALWRSKSWTYLKVKVLTTLKSTIM